MMNPSSLRGLVLGLFLGFVVGYLAFGGVSTSRPADSGELEHLQHQVEAIRRERDGLERNLAEFQKVAESMSQSFALLEQRFKSLEAQMAGSADAAPPETPGER